MTHVLFLTPDLSSNSIGRTFCLDLVARSLGWTTEIASPKGERVWEPLAESDFARRCSIVRLDAAGAPDAGLLAAAAAADILIAVKPLPESFGVARRLSAATGTPLVLDIDDPDFEVELALGRPHRRLAKMVLRRDRYREMASLRATATRCSRMVSNPVLQKAHGGELVPHVRPAFPEAVRHDGSRAPRVVFVGTNRSHKGVPTLRSAVGRLAAEGYRLVVTDDAPLDAAPHEEWVGRTTLEAGLALVRDADIVAIPSSRHGFARGQLPAKLVDAMMAGVAVVVSDVAPLPWAVQDAGLVVAADDEEQLTGALRRLADPRLRRTLGERARQRALATFTVEAVQPSFERACRRATPVAPQQPRLLQRMSGSGRVPAGDVGSFAAR